MSRALIAVTHLLGIGHFARAAAIARALAAAGHDVTLLSGGDGVPHGGPGGVRLVQLPPLHCVGTDFARLLDATGQEASPLMLAERRGRMAAAVAGTRPDVVITELFPFGRRALAGEFLALIEAARSLSPRPAILASIRDILVAPGKPARVDEAHRRLGALYDGVLVHGDPAIVPLEASWPLAGALAPLIHYTGYVEDAAPGSAWPPPGEEVGEVIVSGGGSGASLPLYRAAIAAAGLMPERRWRILVGPAVAAGDFAALAEACSANAGVERSRRDFPGLLARAAVSVSQAGYNTMLDLVRARVRALVVPFEDGRETEQRLRAERFAAHGLVTLLPADGLAAHSLAVAVRRSLAGPRPDAASLDRDGLARTVALVESFVARRGVLTASVVPAAPVVMAADPAAAGWRRIDAALARLRDSGARLGFWWRDDDAEAPTAVLDRLLALAGRFAMPLAIAAIPAKATPGLAARLAARLADAAQARLLVHGLCHRNHAPAGDKRAEFGEHRPPAALRADAAAALAAARRAFGDLLLPVLVPPWNRISPALVADLPGLGFTGLSTFRDRRVAMASAWPAAGLAQVNTHVDPIAWHGGRGLAEDAAQGLAEAIAARLAPGGDASEPIGLLTHHLVQDEATWTFCERLLERVVGHPAIAIPDTSACFASPSPGSPYETVARAGVRLKLG